MAAAEFNSKLLIRRIGGRSLAILLSELFGLLFLLFVAILSR